MSIARLSILPFAIVATLVTLVLVPLGTYLNAPDRGLRNATLEPGVNVSRDEKGIYSIDARDLEGAYRTLGYLHGYDRGVSIRVLRRVLYRRTRRIPRDADATSDVLYQTMASGTAARLLARTDPEEMALLDAYCDGVQQGMNDQPGSLLFSAIFPRRWSPEDTLNLLFGLSLIIDEPASNAWVGVCADGRVALASDPHMGMGTAPGLFYAVTLRIGNSAGDRVTLHAVGPPGLPFFSTAGGSEVGWALTSLHFPFVVSDVARYEITDDNSLVITCRDGKVLNFDDSRWQQRGSTVTARSSAGEVTLFRVVAPGLVEFRVSPWTDSDEYRIGGLLRMPLARSSRELADSVTGFPGLPYLFTIADSAGGKGFVSGFDPLFFLEDGLLPSDLMWFAPDGTRTIWNANDQPGYLRDLYRTAGYAYPDTFLMRAARIEELVNGEPEYTAADFAEWQTSTDDIYAEQKRELLMRAFDSVFTAPLDTDVFAAGFYIDKNQRFDLERVAALLASTGQALRSDAPDPRVSRLLAVLDYPYASRYGTPGDEAEPPSGWIPDVLTEVEQRGAVALSLVQADEEQTLAFRYPLPAALRVRDQLEQLTFDRPQGGAGSLAVFSSSPSRREPFFSSAFRMVAEIGENPRALIAIPPGQSERPGSRHFADFVSLWADGAYHEMSAN